MRLQKWLSDAGVASRRKCEELIRAGRVSVNGSTAELGCCVEEGDAILLDGKPVQEVRERVVIAFNKPRGVLCTAEDPQGRRTVTSYFSQLPYRLYNVGRLDYDSEGLILMTNDGDFAYHMTHPKYELEKTYHAVCDAMLTNAQLAMLQEGVMLDDGMTAPARVEKTGRTERGHYMLDITIHEGRNRQIRRMLQACGRRVVRLQRIRIGSVTLAGLDVGAWRYLTKEEIRVLNEMCK